MDTDRSNLRRELVTGGVLGLLLGGAVTFCLAQEPEAGPPQPTENLAPLHVETFEVDEGEELARWDENGTPRRVATSRAPAQS